MGWGGLSKYLGEGESGKASRWGGEYSDKQLESSKVSLPAGYRILQLFVRLVLAPYHLNHALLTGSSTGGGLFSAVISSGCMCINMYVRLFMDVYIHT
jgi:hypothetical protein